MREYSGQSAKIYELSDRKEACLKPAFIRALPKGKGSQLLDLGCGNGAFYISAKEKGYKYLGLDFSKDMISIAKSSFPLGKFDVANSTNFTKKFRTKSDVIIAMLLLNCLPSKKAVLGTLKQCNKGLASNGRLILGLPHPAYDRYMQKGLLGKSGTDGKFFGYFANEAKYVFNKKFSKGTFKFTQTHFTLADYFELIKLAGFQVEVLDECQPNIKLKKSNPKLYKDYYQFPGYLVLVCKQIKKYDKS